MTYIPGGRFLILAWGPGFTMARSDPIKVHKGKGLGDGPERRPALYLDLQ
jgi:hypothetical protein